MKKSLFLLLAVLCAVTAWGGVAPTSGGKYFIKCFPQSGAAKYLYADGTSLKKGDNDNSDKYVWTVTAGDNDSWTIQNVGTGGYISVANQSANSGKVEVTTTTASVKIPTEGNYAAIKCLDYDQWIDVGWDASSNPSTWGGGVGGSRRMQFIDIEASLKELLTIATGTTVGCYNLGDDNALITAAKAALNATDRTAASLATAKTTLETGLNNLSCVMPAADKTYQIVSGYADFEQQQGVKKAIYANGDHLSWKTVDNNDRSMYWTFEANADGTYKVKNVKTKKYVGTYSANPYPLADEAGSVHIDHFATTTQFKLYTGSSNPMHANDHGQGAGNGGDVIAWDNVAGTASAWTLVEREAPNVATITYTTSDNAWTESYEVLIGAAYPVPSAPFVTFSGVPTGTVSAGGTYTLGYTTTVAANKDAISTWYALDVHNNDGHHPVYADDSNLRNVYNGDVGTDELYTYGAVPSIDYVWGFVGDPFTGVQLYNKGKGKFVKMEDFNDVTNHPVTMDETGSTFKIMPSNGNIANSFSLKVDGYTNYINHRNDKFTGWSSNDEGSSFRAFPVTLADVSEARELAVEYGTVVLPYYAARPEGLTMYTCASVGDNNQLVLTQLNHPGLGDKYLEPNTPYIFQGEVGQTYTFQNTTKGNWSEPVTSGLLTGVYTSTPAPLNSYVLQKQNDVLGFYKVETENIATVGANRCYLTLPAQSGVKAFYFDTATAIGALDALTSGRAEIYDLQGRRLERLQKGVNIVNGHKVIVK